MTAQKFTASADLLKLNGKVAVVTGGAAGLGLAISQRLAEAGAFVYIADIDDSRGEQSVTELKSKGFGASYLHCNVASEKEVVEAIAAVVKEKSSIDILVNNAGVFPRTPLAECTAEQFSKVMAINVEGTFLCSREAAKHMIAAGKGGCIINLASIEAVHPNAGMSAYDASKGAVLTLTKTLAAELGRHDIRVNAIAPGGILTENLKTYLAGINVADGKAQLKNFISRMPLGRMGRPDDIAKVALFLASDLAGYVTGTLVVADGGFLIS
jgi:2-dehydro-3-deoxy-D-gluconate 5-dehydrogenase